jgi:uncharacterized protein
VPSYDLEFDVKPGLQTIEFTPDKVGHVPWSCWMGMKHGDFDVIEEAPTVTPPSQAVAAAPPPTETEAPPPKEAAVMKATQSVRYVVVKGDTLSRIAFKLYHEGSRWREIAAVNPGINFRRLRRGQVLRLPASVPQREKPGEEQKTRGSRVDFAPLPL